MITTAMGYSISCPGLLPPSAIGKSASAVVKAVIMMGASLSSAPRSSKGSPKLMPSLVSR